MLEKVTVSPVSETSNHSLAIYCLNAQLRVSEMRCLPKWHKGQQLEDVLPSSTV